ncbi:MAG: DUF1579 domain-containing protein [Ferruginibacter sp.]|nr:DUF1579 domain-containing protein [Ferruginibacter sp.]
MKKIITLLCIFTTMSFCRLSAQTEAEMKAWQNYMTPGEVHKMMAQSDGEWNDDITMWMDPAAPPTKTTATTKNEMIMGGRYQISKVTGNMMGMPFEGMSLVGYDNAKKIFTSVWVDNFGTGTMTLEGTWDVQTKSITFKGKGIDPMTGKDLSVRQVMKFIDNDKMEMEMYDTKNGTETKTMEIKSTRKK